MQKTTSSDGQRINVKGSIPDLDWIAWEQRKVIIAFDADAGAKDQVRFARAELAQYLKRKGANIGFYASDLARRKGIDDHLASVGPEVVLDEISRVSFHAFDWREELIRSKPTASNKQGTVYPILANALPRRPVSKRNGNSI